MPALILSQINLYPIKSCAAKSLSTSFIEPHGLAFDRRFVIADKQGIFLTGRTHPKLSLIQSKLTPQGLQVTAANMPPLTLNYRDFSSQYQNVQVWNDTINAQHCSPLIDRWFSDYLGLSCQLLYFGERSQRSVKGHRQNSAVKIAFADGYPLLLISQASLDDLNQRIAIDHGIQNQVSMMHFRPNLVVNNSLAFAEDGWQRIRIGEVVFEIVKPCSRCIFTTVDPQTAQKHPLQVPLVTLKKYRFDNAKQEIMFGQNLIALNQGQISVNDKVEILTTKKAFIYVDTTKKKHQNTVAKSQQNIQIPPLKPEQKVNILFDSWNKNIIGNNQNTLLEQGEAAGLIMAYSCRAGMCGRCKVKLESGEVTQLATDGLDEYEKQQGYILACSCVPKTDVVITKI